MDYEAIILDLGQSLAQLHINESILKSKVNTLEKELENYKAKEVQVSSTNVI